MTKSTEQHEVMIKRVLDLGLKADYIFLAFEQRCHDDPRTIGDLFFACSDEIDDLSLAEALQKLLALALDRVRSSGKFVEAAILAMIDAIMGAANGFQQIIGYVAG